MARTGISRRGALTGAASLGVALPVLAACGDDDPGTASDSGSPSPSDRSDSTQGSEPAAPETEPSQKTSEDAARGIASTAAVPVGGGLILAKQELVITQPTKGTFKGFTAICTHAGCTVTEVTDSIGCPCHGSQFSIDDGSVVGGPAPAPLAEVSLKVTGDQINIEE